MTNELAALSEELAAAVEKVGKSVAAIHARPRFGSSGMFWRPGVIVTAEHALRGERSLPGYGGAPLLRLTSEFSSRVLNT